jgi:hypothetical protein
VFQSLLSGQTAKVLLRDDTLRSLIYTPDASRAMALLGNSDDAYQQSWHLPYDDNRLTYHQFVTLAAEVFGVAADYRVLPGWQLAFGRYVNRSLREITELLPRYKADNLFIADKFRSRFPQFEVTSYRLGRITAITICLSLHPLQQTNFFIKADARRRQPGGLCQFTNFHKTSRPNVSLDDYSGTV